MSIASKLCRVPIKFDDKHVSQRTGKKIPLDFDTEEPHDCPYGRVASSTNNLNSSNHSSNRNRRNKGDIINATRIVARRSILMQIIKARAANGFL
jgi:hypothetical protein